ncbi:MAG: DUF4129 domain-containing protein [Salinarimonas sp.]|nr:DUF4129 domain-containing protein [Salinarimonas sp.]
MIGLVMFLVMEGFWLGAIAVLADGLLAGVARPEAALVVLAYPVALVLARPLSRIRRVIWWLAAQALAWSVTAWLLVAFLLPELTLPGVGPQALWQWLGSEFDAQRALVLSLVALFAWIRGVMLAGRRVDAEAVALGFQIGLVALIVVQGWAWAVELALPGAIAANIGFVCAALLALWHVRAARRSGVASPVFALLLVLALAGLVTLAMHPAILAGALGLLQAAWQILRDAIAALFSLLPEPEPGRIEAPEPSGQAAPGPPPEPQAMFEPIVWLRMLVSIIFIGGMAILIGTLLVMNLQGLLAWLRRRLNETPGIAHDRSRRSLLDTLREIGQHLGEAFRIWMRKLRRSFSLQRPGLVLERRRYRALLQRLESKGWPRLPHETPAEYARRMRKVVWPGPGGDIATMSQTYSASRYGGVRPSESRFAQLWKKTRRSLRKVPLKQ